MSDLQKACNRVDRGDTRERAMSEFATLVARHAVGRTDRPDSVEFEESGNTCTIYFSNAGLVKAGTYRRRP